MYGKCSTACIQGIDGVLVHAEADLTNGLPQFAIVGLPDSAVREAAERVRAALRNSGYEFPLRRITVNLAPADVRKEGASFDLAIAACLLLASRQWPQELAEGTLFLGELGLSGDVRAVPGVLPMALAAREAGLSRIVVPRENVREAALAGGIEVVPVGRLTDVPAAAGFAPCAPDVPAASTGIQAASDFTECPAGRSSSGEPDMADFADVVGQLQSKRALAIAAAGRHNIVFIGPPGSGKTMLMRRLAGILPPLDDEEALEVTKIYSACGRLADRGSLVRRRPFRAPHHTITAQGLVGGGASPQPGEASLAHRGVLFLDELPEFSRAALEALRQPLEDGVVTVARSRGNCTFPAKFMLTATMNPCRCGYDGYEEDGRACTCAPQAKSAYLARLSGPLMDRIDMTMDVPRLRQDETAARGPHAEWSEAAEAVAARYGDTRSLRELVERAREMQRRRYAGTSLRSNAELAGSMLVRHCRLSREASVKLVEAYGAFALSARAHDKVLRVARTIADLDGSERIEAQHMNEALLYRAFDMRLRRLREGEKVDNAGSGHGASVFEGRPAAKA